MTPEHSSETWVVTGAARGIGLAVCRAHLARGGTVVATCRGALPDSLEALHQRFDQRLRVLQWDLSGPLPPTGSDRLGDLPVDVIFANAGVFGPRESSFRNPDYAGLLQAFDINALGFVRLVDTILPYMADARHPRIAAVSSLMGTVPGAGPGSLGYRLSKAALNMAVHVVAAELAPQKIAVAGLRPGWVRTAMGGPNGQISPEQSAAGLLGVVDALAFTAHPQFLDLNGDILPW